MYPDEPDRQEPQGGVESRSRRRPGGEEEPARKVTLAIALTVTFVFLLATAAGLGWFLSDGGPFSGGGSASEADGRAADETGDDEAGGDETGGGSPSPEGAVEDPRSGLTYQLPGEGWQRLGDDEVPPEYYSYAVYGSAEDPDAIIVTGSEQLHAAEPMAVAGVRLAVESLGGLVTDVASLEVEPSGATDVGGSPAFGVAVDGGGDEASYGRFLLVETGDRNGAFMLGINTDGGEEATAAIDEAFASVGVL
jgi:hypothetical protein